MQIVDQPESVNLPSQDSGIGSVLTDTVLSELKQQSTNGCLLCSFDTWDEEEWD
ncbi:MAG: hypothetical protein JO185_26790 [Acidobacteriaceae bacterium]|nr:hypothetical protein [Acidobacteriaceae bacterium]